MRRLMAVLLVGLCGCGGGTTTVTGKVTHKGKTVVSGAVLLVGSDGELREGAIAADGTFAVDNVPAGTVKVGVNSPNPNPPAAARDDPGRMAHVSALAGTATTPTAANPAAAGWFTLPEEYRDPDNSGVTIEVKPGQGPVEVVLP